MIDDIKCYDTYLMYLVYFRHIAESMIVGYSRFFFLLNENFCQKFKDF